MRCMAPLVLCFVVLALAPSTSSHEASSLSALCEAIRANQPNPPTASTATPESTESGFNAEQIVATITGLPAFEAPVQVGREANSGSGTVVLTSQTPLGAIEAEISAHSGEAGPIGEAVREGGYLIFSADHITYNLDSLSLPGGIEVGPQSMDLDPSHADVLCFDTTTGAVFRHFRWVVTATNMTFDGNSSLTLEDTARIDVLGFTQREDGQSELRLRTRWKGKVDLDDWSVAGVPMPGGEIDASADFEDAYLVGYTG